MKRLIRSLIIILLTAGIVSAAGYYAPHGLRYIPQLTTQGTTDYTQIVLNEIATDDLLFSLNGTAADVLILKTKSALFKTLGDVGYETLSAAITTIGGTSTTLIIPAGAWVGGGVTVPSNVTLKILDGGYFTVANGTTLTINGPIEAGPYRIFSYTGTGVVDMTASPTIASAAWWGAVAGGTGQEVPICAALKAAKKVRIEAGTYTVTPWEFYVPTNLFGGIIVPSGRELFGDKDRTIVKLADSANVSGRIITNEVNVPATNADRDTDIYIHDLTIDGNRANNAGATQFQMGIEYRAVCRGKIENVRVYSNMGDAVNIGYSTSTDVHSYDIVVKGIHGYLNNRNGISITGAEKVVVSDFLFEDGGLSGIDIEPDDSAYAVNADIVITNGVIRDVALTNHLSTDIAYGISVVGAGYLHPVIEKVAISNVAISSVNGANGFGIVYRFVRGLTISNCVIKDCGNTGIETVDEPDALGFLGTCATDWVTSKGAGWAYNAGTDMYDATAGSESDLSYTTAGANIIVVGQLYRVDFQVANFSAGSVTPYLGTTAGTAVTANGYYTQYLYAAGNVNFIMKKDAAFVGSVDTMRVTRQTTSDIAVSNCAILSGATGMILGGAPRNTTVTNCIFSGQTSIGLQCAAGEFVFANNIFRDVLGQSMYFSKALNGVVSGNSIFMCYNGINIQESVESLNISNNTITGCTNIGYYVNGEIRGSMVIGNVVRNNVDDENIDFATYTSSIAVNNINITNKP